MANVHEGMMLGEPAPELHGPAPQPVDAVAALQQQVAQLSVALHQYEQQLAAIQQQQAQVPARSPKIPKPPEFDGRKPTPLNWTYTMETYLTAEGGVQYLTTSAAIFTAAGYLRGAALNWWRNHEQAVATGRVTQFRDWQEFKSALINQFTPLAPDESARDKLDTLKQTASVYRYAQDYTACMLELPNMDEADRIHHFVNGLKPKVKIHVKLQNPKSLNEAIEAAMRTDSMLWNGKSNGSQTYNNNPGPVPMELGSTEGRTSDKKVSVNKPIRCFKCQMLGHKARDCRAKQKTSVRKPTN